MQLRSQPVVWILACLLFAQPLRAQFTESTAPAPKGRLYVEMDVYSFSQDCHTEQRDGVHWHSHVLASTLFNTGLSERVDLQFGFGGHNKLRWSGADSGRLSGEGDLYVRSKWNISGREGEGFSTALLPWVVFPTGREGLSVESTAYGLLFPFSMPAGEGLLVSGMLGASSYGDFADGRDLVVSATLCLTKTFSDRWSGFAEFLADVGVDKGASKAVSGGLGLLYSVSDNLQIGVSGYIALNRPAPDFASYLSLYVTF